MTDEDRVAADADGGHVWLAGLFEEVDDCLYLKDREGRYLDANSATAAVPSSDLRPPISRVQSAYPAVVTCPPCPLPWR